LELDFGEKKGGCMSSTTTNKVVYEEGTFGKLQIVDDFLPTPAELAREDEKVKVTLNLSKTSVDFLKKEAKKQGLGYQTMIRNVVDYYVAKQ
jgi:predicted DNA binding CopG/RHH family protein